MAQEKQTYNKKTELSLSALMFFSPLIQNQIKKKSDISQTDISFIKGFIKLGYFNIVLLLLTIGLQIIYYLKQNILIQKISLLVTIILACFLVFGVILVIIDKPILTQKNKQIIKKNNKLDTILSYIPLYNIYLRYNKHNFENPDITLKESIIRRSIFSIIFLISTNNTITRFFVAIIILRVITLMSDIDISDNLKEIINKFFKKNPEEMRGYLIGIIITIFNKKKLKENIKTQTQDFGLILKIEYKHVLLQHIILFIVGIFVIYNGIKNDNTGIIAPILFIFSRYLIMIIKWKRTTQIPILKEISSLFFKKKFLGK